jgi:hypothetical protein
VAVELCTRMPSNPVPMTTQSWIWASEPSTTAMALSVAS